MCSSSALTTVLQIDPTKSENSETPFPPLADLQLTYGMYATMGLEGPLGNATHTDSSAPVVRNTLYGFLSSPCLKRGILARIY